MLRLRSCIVQMQVNKEADAGRQRCCCNSSMLQHLSADSHAAEYTAQARQRHLGKALQSCLVFNTLTEQNGIAHKLRIAAKSPPCILGVRRRAQGTTSMLCASRAASLCEHTCQHLQQLCYLLPTADLSGHAGFLHVRTERRYGRALVLAEGAWVRQPACGTEDSRCACRAICRRSAHGRHAGTWAALSPFGPGQSPPGRLGRCWPVRQQQDEAA